MLLGATGCLAPEGLPKTLGGDALFVARGPNVGLVGVVTTDETPHFTLQDGDTLYEVPLVPSAAEEGLSPGRIGLTELDCVDGVANRSLEELVETQPIAGHLFRDGAFESLSREAVIASLTSVYRPDPLPTCTGECRLVLTGRPACREECAASCANDPPRPPLPPAPPAAPRSCSGSNCVPLGPVEVCPSGEARGFADVACAPVGADCGPDLNAWPPGAVGVRVVSGVDDLQAAIDGAGPNGTLLLRGDFSDAVVEVAVDQTLELRALCGRAARVGTINVRGRVTLRDLSIEGQAVGARLLERGSELSLFGVWMRGPGQGTAVDVEPGAWVRGQDVLLEGFEVGVAARGSVELRDAEVRAGRFGVEAVGPGERVELTRVRLVTGRPDRGIGLLVRGATVAADQLAVHGPGFIGLDLEGGQTTVRDLWVDRQGQASVSITGTRLRLERAALIETGLSGFVGQGPEPVVLSDLTIVEGPGNATDSEGLAMHHGPDSIGGPLGAVELRRARVEGAHFGNAIVLGHAQAGTFTGTEPYCQERPFCHLLEDVEVVGDLDNERASVALQLGDASVVVRRVEVRGWPGVGVTFGPDARLDAEDLHFRQGGGGPSLRFRHYGVRAELRRLRIAEVGTGLEFGLGDLTLQDLTMVRVGQAIYRGLADLGGQLDVDRFNIEACTSGISLGGQLFDFSCGTIAAPISSVVASNPCSDPYRGLNQVRITPTAGCTP